MSDAQELKAPKVWRGRFFEDFDVGDVFKSRIGRTVTEVDNIWFTALTMNTNQVHFNSAFAERTKFGKPLMNSTFTLALVAGLSVMDTSENGTANLSWGNIEIPNPVYAGDTIWAESEIIDLRASSSRPSVGIVSMRTRGVNQDGAIVLEYTRAFMCYRRDAPEVADMFPHVEAPWQVGSDS